MTTPPVLGIDLKARIITIIVGIFAIMTGVSTFFKEVDSYNYRLTTVENSMSAQGTDIRDLTGEIKQLNSKLTELTIEIREIKAINQALQKNDNKKL